MPGAEKLRADKRLVVPERLIVDEVARERLERRLGHAPVEVVGVAGEVRELTPGSSYRVAAEWASLAPVPTQPLLEGEVRGAALLRAGVEYRVDGDRVEVPHGSLILDPGAFVHDPWRHAAAAPASAQGRSPFPRRPVVLFAALEPDPTLEDWARRMVNRLVRRDIEGRLALGGGSGSGLHLTRPCTVSPESVEALVPAVIVTLDDAAARTVPQWCTDRSTVVVHYDAGAPDAVELVSWHIRRAAGRVRARIGPRVDAPTMTALVHRLGVGPQPVAPVDEPAEDVAPARRAAAPSAVQERRAALVMTNGLDAGATARARGLVDNLTAAGIRVEVASLGGEVPDTAYSTPLAVLFAGGNEPIERVDAMIGARRAGGLATVLDVGANALSERTRDLARACGLVAVATGAARRAADALGVRVMTVPSLLTRGGMLRRCCGRARPTSCPRSRSDGASTNDPYRAIKPRYFEAVSTVLSDRPEVRLTVVGRLESLPSSLPAAACRVALDRDLAPEAVSGWTVNLWNPARAGGKVAEDLLGVVEASVAGVPTALPTSARPLIEGYVDPLLVIDDPSDSGEWIDALAGVLDDPARRTLLSHETVRYARSIYGPVASTVSANRFYGWATYRGEQ